MKPWVYALLSVASLASQVRAEGPGLPPAEEAIRALDNHPSVVAAHTRVTAARAQADMLRAGPNEFILSGSYVQRRVDHEAGFIDGARYNEVDTTLSRTVRLPHKAALDRKAGALGVTVAENHGEDVRHQAALLLLRLWYDWLQAGALARNDAAMVDVQNRALAALERRVASRDAAQLEADQARAAVAVSEAQVADSRAKLETARAALAASFPEIALPADPPAVPDPSMPEQEIAALHDLVVARSHEIGAATAEAERLDALATRARADRIPDPTLGLRVFNERGGMEHGVGVTVSVPLGWSHRRASAEKASAEASAAAFDSMDVRRQVQVIADSDAADVVGRTAAWRSLQSSAASAGDAEARTTRGYELGGIDLADLLLIRRQVNEARRAEIVARLDAARAIARLMVDSHAIWSDDHDEPASR